MTAKQGSMNNIQDALNSYCINSFGKSHAQIALEQFELAEEISDAFHTGVAAAMSILQLAADNGGDAAVNAKADQLRQEVVDYITMMTDKREAKRRQNP